MCLNETLLKIFGESGKESIGRIIAAETLQETSISSQKDIWKLYDEFLARTASRFGIDVSQVIRFESLKEMELMFCTKCPLYGRKSGTDEHKNLDIA